MYNEGRSFLLRDVIIKVLLVLLFVFLLIWLFPMPNLNPVYDRIFGENIKTMTEAAKSYYTIERLPKNVGDKVTLTLKEMLENKMILPFVDSDNKSCDATKSFVEIVRMEDEYLIKTTLSCPSKTDYVIEYLGCYDICGDLCDEEEKELQTQYQFYRQIDKKVVDSYGCISGYNYNGSKCVRTTSTVDTKNATISCATGYNYNNTSKKCEKPITSTVNATINCATGYIYNLTSKTCLKADGETVNATINCATGYNYNNTSKKCEKPITSTVNANTSCSFGYDYNIYTNKCEKNIYDNYSATPECSSLGIGYIYDTNSKMCIKDTTTRLDAQISVCPVGYIPSGSRCAKEDNIVIDADPKCAVNYNYNYTTKKCEKVGTVVTYSSWVCSNEIYAEKQSVYNGLIATRVYMSTAYGYEDCASDCYIPYYTYEECYRKATYTSGIVSSVAPTYSCPIGTPASDSSKCNVYTIYYVAPIAFACPTGVTGRLDGAACYVTSRETAQPIYSCTNGGTRSGTTCTKVITDAINPTYGCPSGYTPNGTTCTRVITDAINPTYVCPNGYNPNGTTCTKVTTDAKAPTYSCANGYNPNGTTCTKVITDAKAPTYICPTGYNPNGTTCNKTISVTDTKTANITYKTISTKEYKWSTKSKLDGWISTGKTKLIEI